MNDAPLHHVHVIHIDSVHHACVRVKVTVVIVVVVVFVVMKATGAGVDTAILIVLIVIIRLVVRAWAGVVVAIITMTITVVIVIVIVIFVVVTIVIATTAVVVVLALATVPGAVCSQIPTAIDRCIRMMAGIVVFFGVATIISTVDVVFVAVGVGNALALEIIRAPPSLCLTTVLIGIATVAVIKCAVRRTLRGGRGRLVGRLKGVTMAHIAGRRWVVLFVVHNLFTYVGVIVE